MLYTKDSNLQKRVGKKLNSYEREIERANVVKQILNINQQRAQKIAK